ncbi:Zn(2)-C6 fungal-type DNA-binding domain [Fusarium oxysporum f. sp. vasinfectum]|nr:Zn(2)-C6 fungal-type DNA-binding domain [Fusarium oxysporum f. sp. vasinfectum]
MEDTGLRRTHRACAPCRRKKVKCPGERPKCSFCQRLGQACEYKAVETFSPQEIQNQISGIVGASVPNTIQPQSITPEQEQRISEPSNSEDQELLRAGQLYQTWCHNQPVRMFRQEDFLDTLKHRDTELQLAVKMLTYRFPPGQISADKNAALCLFICVMSEVGDGPYLRWQDKTFDATDSLSPQHDQLLG